MSHAIEKLFYKCINRSQVRYDNLAKTENSLKSHALTSINDAVP